MSDPALPAGVYASAVWTNLEDTWRAEDASWLQGRSIRKYQGVADRQADLGSSPPAGTVTYNEAADRLEIYSRLSSAWVGIRQSLYLVSPQDSASGVSLAHASAGGTGIMLTPTLTKLTKAVEFLDPAVAGADSASFWVRTGAANKQARFLTDATQLTIDQPVSIPALTLTGTGPVALSATGKAATLGSLTVGTVTLTDATLNGTISGPGGVVNVGVGTIGGVALGTAGSGWITMATGGVRANAGQFTGDTVKAITQFRNPTSGALGTARVEVETAITRLYGTTELRDQVKVGGGRAIQWYKAATAITGTQDAWIAPVIYSATDPGVANFPDGTIWIS